MSTTNENAVILKVPPPAKWIAETLDEEGHYWLLLGLTEEMNRQIEELSLRTSDSKATLINKALGLYKAASDAAHAGNRVGIASPDQELETEFVGF
jgi:hypothetical protein